MALATTCPQCKTSFKVNAEQLKQRRGLVRCGVCQHVFSGVDFLRYVDDRANAAQSSRPKPAAQDPAAPDPTQRASRDASSSAASGASSSAASGSAPASSQQPPTRLQSPPAPAALPEVPGGLSFPDLDYPDSTVVAPAAAPSTPASAPPAKRAEAPMAARASRADAFIPTAESTDAGAEVEAESFRDDSTHGVDRRSAREDRRRGSSRTEQRRSEDKGRARREDVIPEEADVTPLSGTDAAATAAAATAAAAAPRDDGPRRSGRRSSRSRQVELKILGGATEDELAFSPQMQSPLWRHLAIAAGIVFGLLMLLFFRDGIAAHLPFTRPALSFLAAPMGLAIEPPRRLASMKIESFEIQDNGSGPMLMTALIRNVDTMPLRWPAMELSLKDQRGTLIVRRVFLPSEMLPGQDLSRGALPGVETPVRLMLDTGSFRPAGYSVELFYP